MTRSAGGKGATCFADVLEAHLGPEAQTGFASQVARGASEAIGAGADLARGNVVSGTLKAGKYLIDATRGVNQENKIRALRALLKSLQKPRTVFGRGK